MTSKGKTGASGFFSTPTAPAVESSPLTPPAVVQEPVVQPQPTPAMAPAEEAPSLPPASKPASPTIARRTVELKKKPLPAPQEPTVPLNVEIPESQMQWLHQQKVNTKKKLYEIVQEILAEKMLESERK